METGGASKPVISVAVVTYNHRAFIAEALESALGQKIQEPFEIVVADDASTDGTGDVVREIARRRPDIIRLLPSPKNLGALANGRRAFEACRGQFLAVLEGDDFWTSDSKLSKQLAYLRENPDCALCFHPVTFVDRDGQPTGQVYSMDLPDSVTLRDFLGHPWTPIHINSVLFRSSAFSRPAWIERLAMGDWPLLALALRHGKGGRLPDPMSVYRLHEEGIWTGRADAVKTQGHLEATRIMRHEIGPGFERELDQIEYFHLWRSLEYAQQERAHGLSFALSRDLFRLAKDPGDQWRWAKTAVREGALAIPEYFRRVRGRKPSTAVGGEAGN